MMRREDYKAVKHMDREQMNAYLERVYKRAYRAGYEAGIRRGYRNPPAIEISPEEPGEGQE